MASGCPEIFPEKPRPSHEPRSGEDLGSKERDIDNRSIHSITPSEQSTAASAQDIEIADDVLQRTITPKRPIVRVPRAERRGLFARFALVAEVTEPVDYKNGTKWFVTFIVAIAAAAAPIGSGIIFPTLDEVARELHTTPTTTNLSVALYMLSMAIFPLWWSAFSEASGRRSVYIVSFALFILFAVLSAVSKSIAMLVVMRMLSGGAAASVQAVGAGTIADLWESRERGRAMGIFYLGPLCGPLFSPVVGGVLGQHWNWRATQWALAIYGVLTWLLIFFALPETLKRRKDFIEEAAAETVSVGGGSNRPGLSRTSTREVVQQRSKTYLKAAKKILVDPLGVILYLRFMPVLLTVYYAAVTFGSLYVLNVSIQYTFEREPYDFSTIIIGLLYLPNSVGYMLASIFGGRWMDSIMKREAMKADRVDEQGKLIFYPEDRMRENAWLGALLYPSALIWYGWTAEKGVFWFAPMCANFFYGIGSMLIFAMSTTMLTEFMPARSSSGVALNNFCRNIFSCVGGIVGAPLIAVYLPSSGAGIMQRAVQSMNPTKSPDELAADGSAQCIASGEMNHSE
ncbi:MFS general substrate transporter, partial [Aureobasidium melanogenum]